MGFFKKWVVIGSFLAFLGGISPAMAVNPYPVLASGGVGGWLNVNRPLTEEDMKGRLVLLDFWTYGCINCMQIVPDLKYLEQKYGDKLLIIGVHSAKFKGEQGNARILSAAKRFGLEHPVINDADFAIWKQFKVNAWPTQILLGADGNEVSRYAGEGHRNALDKDISSIIKTVTATSETFVVDKREQTVLSFPARIKMDGDMLYIADSGHNRIVAVSKDGKIIKSFDGLNNPRGFAVWNGKKIYVANTNAHQLVEVDVQSGQKNILAGDGTRGREWASPWDIGFTPSENIIIAMAGTHRLNQYDTVKKATSILAGNGRENIKDGANKDAELAQPSALSVAKDGTVYFLDAETSSLRMLKDGQVKTLIGTGLFDFGLKDGAYPTAQLQHAQGLDVVGDKVYIADTYNNAIRVYDIPSAQLSTVKTTGETLNEPGSIAVDGDMAYIADTNNNRILKLDFKTGMLSDFKISE